MSDIDTRTRVRSLLDQLDNPNLSEQERVQIEKKIELLKSNGS